MTTPEFSEYSSAIQQNYQNGDYTEYTNRTPIENLITSLDKSFNLTHEAKRQAELGAPDFTARRDDALVGYIETKDLDKDLSDILGTEQIERYLDSIDNVILTNYSRFILLRNSEKVLDIRLFEEDDLSSGSVKINEEKIERLNDLFAEFYSYKHETIESPKRLALEMSQKAQILKELSENQLETDQEEGTSSSVSEFQRALEGLLDDVDNEFTADAFAETVTYSLFLARVNSEEEIKYDEAYKQIPKSIAIIRELFFNIAGDEMNDNISWVVEGISDLLNVTDIESIKNEMDFRGTTDKDPFSHFYEYFLSEYNETRRQNRGEYYTPRPVVNYISNMVNHTLKENFDKRLGLAQNDVKVLDPAVGTGTFLWLTYLVAIKELQNNGLKGTIGQEIENHFLEDFYGIELMFTPYIISHLKLAMVLKDWDYELEDDDRIQVYLSNSLEPEEETEGASAFLNQLDEESRKANKIKQDEDIIAILGNPPYKGESENKGEWINSLLKGYERADGSEDDGYYQVDGESIDEKNSRYLKDDYVKFIRFSQWKIDQNDKGVAGLITNHSFLDNPTFRGMRESLMESFHRIFVINLHGNQRRKEQGPNGEKDENVFNIKQGVCITIFVRNPDKFDESKVLYADKYGNQSEKFGWLDRVQPDSDADEFIQWQELEPDSPDYLMVERDEALQEQYRKFWKLTDIFDLSFTGLQTSNDTVAIERDSNDLWEKVQDMSEGELDKIREKWNVGEDKTGWELAEAQNDLRSSGPEKSKIEKLLYKPFDYRYTYFTGESHGFIHRPRKNMHHMLEENIALLSARSNKSQKADHFYVTDSIAEVKSAEKTTGTYIFPLWKYNKDAQSSLGDLSDEERVPNLTEEFIEELDSKFDGEINPREVLNYIYGILHSKEYRETYSELMKTDFPRVPIVDSYEKFSRFEELGEKLVKLHLLETDTHSGASYPEGGNNEVEKVEFEDDKIYLNNSQYFDGISEDVWKFSVGGYQVLKYWLKKRKGTSLSSDEIQEYLQIIGSIEKTLLIMEQIDEEYVDAEF